MCKRAKCPRVEMSINAGMVSKQKNGIVNKITCMRQQLEHG